MDDYSLATASGSVSRFKFFAVPVKVKGMGTFPVRAFAIVGGMNPPATAGWY